MALDLEFLKSKKGPFPVWVYAVLVALVAVAAFYIIRGRAKLNAVSGDSTGQVSTDPYAAFTAAALQSTTSANGTGVDTGSMETNTSWLQKVVNFLLGKGIDPLTAQAAAQTYLDGAAPLTSSQASLVSQGITQFGLPPEGVFGIPTVAADPSVDPLKLSDPKLYYVPANKSWGVIGPSGVITQTNNQTVANGLARQYGNSVIVDASYFQSVADANRSA